MLRRVSPSRKTLGCGRLTAVCLVAAAFAAFGAPSVEAGCGDYVAIGGEHVRPMASHARAAGGELANSDGLGSLTEPMKDHRGPQPCQGPNCRRQAPTPPAPAPVSHASTVDHWACLSLSAPESQGAFSRSLFSAAISLPAGFHRLPEHPPRG